MGETYSIWTENKDVENDNQSEYDCKSAFEADGDDIDGFIKENYKKKRNSKKSKERSKRRHQASKKRQTYDHIGKTLVTDEKKSTEDEYDETDICTLLPKSPTIEDAYGSK